MIKRSNKSINSILFLLPMVLATSLFASSSSNDAEGFSFFLIIVGLFGGLGMFLYGMEMMSDGMKMTAGNRMRAILKKLTSNRFIAVFVGAFITMIIQSSSATTVMLVSFVNSGLLNFVQALGVILGSNIGSTVTAQIVAFKVTDYALLLIAVGSIMTLFSKKDTAKHIGFVILGFGLLFYGMKVMSDTMKPLRTDPTFNSILTSFENPFLGILAGAIFTALIQSSSATTGIVITLASSGSITLEAGIPLIFGANIGTCITALLAGLKATRDAKRVAIGHVLFNLVGVLAFCFWIPAFADLVAQTTDNVPRQIANAHTIFNIVSTILFIPFAPFISKTIIRYFPDKEKLRNIEKPAILNLDEKVLSYPTAAINNAQAEISGVVGLTERVVGSLVSPFITDKDQSDVENPELNLITGLHQRLEKIKYLNENISNYLIKISQQDLTSPQSREVFALVSATNYLNSINDTVKLKFENLIGKKESLDEGFSDAGQEEILVYHAKLLKQIKRLNKYFAKYDRAKATKIMKKGKKYKGLEEKYRLEHFKRVSGNVSVSVATHQLHVELMDMLKQINTFIELIASTLLVIEEA
ncbi:MAG TPA: Na/Pi cotransporter family protein [Candidatus Marinimicrobia bacterium]|jgi:phosphate:Na+ symporter|nr:Na/Pi cotransporter family protein [Candidatus Neomarinimicrobiota bacterium]MDP6261127.1 Na/Pi cotransporter family protein [Candidatus Neomarinimicrobiota bacterium]MDP7126017.1 Na/Pi cotransporter family protein [Candidatus Neomarinimicrobiota bacterium]MDP7336828.1 Na/Pi cotransporter family protein [Candidatus Neomarinimicrobiota bacterium]MDP7475510.1 Na/Pi cotransporter family protein [Candidatus Neomarinimicrobiota bacterium]